MTQVLALGVHEEGSAGRDRWRAGGPFSNEFPLTGSVRLLPNKSVS